MKCRHCATGLDPSADVFLDLGAAPPSNAFLREEDLATAERHFPLKVLACPTCRLVQADEVQRHEALFSDDYVYFSSYSTSWVAHARRYVDEVVGRLALGPQSTVMEVASNDGYLLQHVKARGIPCIGIEPTACTAAAARAKGIETIGEFFGAAFAGAIGRAQRGRPRARQQRTRPRARHQRLRRRLPGGARARRQRHGRVSRTCCNSCSRVSSTRFTTSTSRTSPCDHDPVFAAQGLTVWDVEALPTHGGSLRVWAQHGTHPRRDRRRGRRDAEARGKRRNEPAGVLSRPASARRPHQGRTGRLS
jgi:hypothetical protein